MFTARNMQSIYYCTTHRAAFHEAYVRLINLQCPAPGGAGIRDGASGTPPKVINFKILQKL
jgi:hypothetical protein